MTNKPTIPSAGRYKLQYRGTECTNCGHPLDMSDKFCPNCSQANSTKKLSLKDFFDEFFSSIISYDSKLFNTLSAMLWRPGKITHDYINGKRVSYTNPFRFLLSLTIIYFLMMTVGGDFSGLDRINLDGNELNDIKVKEGILDVTVKDQDADVQAILDSVPDLGFIANAIARKDSIMLADPNAHYDSIAQGDFLTRFFEKRELFGLLLDKEKILGYEELKSKYKILDSRENQAAFNAARSFSRAKKNPRSFATSTISKLPFAIFFFLPLFALFIWLVYIRKKYNYTDHLIFSFHNTSLLFILLIISYLIDSIFDIDSSWFFLIVFLIYLFIGMKRFYGQGIFKTSIKYVFLNMIFFILATFSMLIFFAGNIFTF